MPLGVDDDLVDTRGDRESARRRLQIPPEAVFLRVLGRITPSQKMDLAPLLKTFARQILPRARRPDCRSSPPASTAPKDLVDDGEDGFLVDTWWCEADPLAEVIEVMDPNIAQLVQAQGVAIDLDQLADRVLTLVHDPALRARMGARGRRKVDRDYRFSVG